MRPQAFDKAGTSPTVQVLQMAQELRRRPFLGYVVAFLSVGLASLLQWLCIGQYDGSPFLTIYPAVILTALIGGREAGFVAAVLAGMSQWGLFIPQAHWFAVASYAFDATVAVMLIDYINRTLDLLLLNIDREKQAKQHQYLLAKELHHRIQNLFTVIQAVIRFSLPGDGVVKESAVKQRLMDRLQSMSATHRAITDSMGGGVRLVDLVGNEIRGFESRFDIRANPGVVLSPQMTQNLSLILHELLTNAIKYGALSVARGRVDLRLDWDASVLTLVWQEHDGPLVSEPATTGFGSRILGAFAKSFCRDVQISYEPGGLRYALQIDSDQIACTASVSRAPVGATGLIAGTAAAESGAPIRAPALLDREAV